jgi:hypothetical protein
MKTILYVFMLLFVGILVIHTVLFALHKLRIFIHDKCCNGKVQNVDQTNTIELNSVCKGISDFVFIGFWNCSDIVVFLFFVFHFTV